MVEAVVLMRRVLLGFSEGEFEVRLDPYFYLLLNITDGGYFPSLLSSFFLLWSLRFLILLPGPSPPLLFPL